ncbi:MAG: hypothetical protein FWE02_07360 [Defluviitaleaceae bacterium]|nr:hypothetical protein [Defluviitaleaceae bacterium]
MYKNAGFDVISPRKFEKNELQIRQGLLEQLMPLASLDLKKDPAKHRIIEILALSPKFYIEKNSKNVLVSVSKQGLQNLVFENFIREEEEDWLGQKNQ